MTRQDDGFGRTAGPNPGSQSDFSNRPGMGAPSAQAWSTQPSEVGLMGQGAGRPVRPATGQRPMFGGGSPVFAQMPSYTPVTRGADLRPQIPEPSSTYSPYGGQPPQHADEHGSGLGYPSPQAPLNYPGAYAEPAPSYQSPQPGAAPSYQSAQRVASGYDAASNYQATDFGGQAYQPFQPAPFRGTEQPGSQPYAASGYDEFAGLPEPGLPRPGLHRSKLRRAGRGRCEFPGVELRSEFRRSQIRQPEFRQAWFRRCGLLAAAGIGREFPRSGFSRRRESGPAESPGRRRLRCARRRSRSRFRTLRRRTGAGLRPGRAEDRSPAPTASFRRNLRSAAADRARFDRTATAAGAELLRERASRCRFPRRRADASARHAGQERLLAQEPERLHGRKRASRRDCSRRRACRCLQAERRRPRQRTAALGPGRQHARQGSARPARRQGIPAQEQADLRPLAERRCAGGREARAAPGRRGRAGHAHSCSNHPGCCSRHADAGRLDRCRPADHASAARRRAHANRLGRRSVGRWRPAQGKDDGGASRRLCRDPGRSRSSG